jgi:hypothetical protein
MSFSGAGLSGGGLAPVKSVKETAALMQHLHIASGPIEHFIGALFDPDAVLLRLAGDGTVEVVPPAPAPPPALTLAPAGAPPVAASGSPAAAAGQATAELSPRADLASITGLVSFSLDDFAAGSGASAPLSPLSSSPPPQPSQPPQPQPSPQPSPQLSPTARRASLAAAPSLSLNSVVPALLPTVRALLSAQPDGVARFVMGLEARRSEGSPRLTRPSLEAAALAMLAALTVTEARADFPRARSLMALAQNFFAVVLPEDAGGGGGGGGCAEEAALAAAEAAAARGEGPVASAAAAAAALEEKRHRVGAPLLAGRTVRLYLQARVRSHRLFSNPQFWESAVYEAVGTELAQLGGHAPAAGGGGGKGVPGRAVAAAATEARQRESDVVFGQLGFFAFTMASFGVQEDACVCPAPPPSPLRAHINNPPRHHPPL